MRKYGLFITGLLFLVVASVVLFSFRAPLLFPSVEVDIHGDAELGPVYKGFLFIQEFTAPEDYLDGVDLLLGNLEPDNSNMNNLLLLDKEYRILERFRIPGKEVDLVKFYPFYLSRPAFVGKGNTVYLCLYSPDGVQQNNIALARKAKGDVGKIFVAPLVNEDPVQTLKTLQGNAFDGSFAMRLYTSDGSVFYGLRGFLFILLLMVSLFIAFFRQIRPLLLRFPIRPDLTCLGLGLIAGIIMVFVTPPLQVPDERVHYFASYRVSEFKLFDFDSAIPKSMEEFTVPFERLKFHPIEKLRREDIKVHSATPLNEHERVIQYAGNYSFPYLFPALGVFTGRLFDLSPLNLMYAGRISNLLLTLLLLFLAIRITPVQKWLFFLLGMMPMMVNQMASLSYDGITYGLTFLMLAMIFRLAFDSGRPVLRKDIIWLFVVALFLGLCKPPYMMVCLAFLIIPVSRIGSAWKYLLVFTGLIIVVFMAARSIASLTTLRSAKPVAAATDSLTVSARDTTVAAIPDSAISPKQEKVIRDPNLQMKFLIENPGRYPGIIMHTMDLAWKIYLSCFIGLLGWVDTPLPGWLVYCYLALLLITSLVVAEQQLRIGIFRKAYLFLLFVVGFLLILTAMYIYANVLESPVIHAVQGRYFIPLAPMFFILFYNMVMNRRLDRLFAPAKPVRAAGKMKAKAEHTSGPSSFEPVFTRIYQLFLVAAVIGSLLITFFTILSRYYVITQ